VRRLHREYATLNAAHDGYAEAYARQAQELETRGLARRGRDALRRMARR
jgi:hypothetical protein